MPSMNLNLSVRFTSKNVLRRERAAGQSVQQGCTTRRLWIRQTLSFVEKQRHEAGRTISESADGWQEWSKFQKQLFVNKDRQQEDTRSLKRWTLLLATDNLASPRHIHLAFWILDVGVQSQEVADSETSENSLENSLKKLNQQHLISVLVGCFLRKADPGTLWITTGSGTRMVNQTEKWELLQKYQQILQQ